LGKDSRDSYKKALAGDPVSAFGGIACFSGAVDEKTASLMSERFFEIIVAKNFEKKALTTLKKRKNLRIIKISNYSTFLKKVPILASVNDTVLVQDRDVLLWNDLVSVTKKKPVTRDTEELKFAWIVCKYIKSNAVVFTRDFQLIGSCPGQTSRIDSAKFGAKKAKDFGFDLKGSYLASDAYFPFSDNIKLANKMGVKAIIQPGGSIRDKDVIAAADNLGLVMVFTGMRHFNH
ncbi:MAG: bifunctional phosphoribosylaminoimidazolecarboxamide formyltransferase/IMP cyclohydrolase, partial [Spirochaetes bacterium]|nr:bifunctional phosphoribosylaminoimidazolecarboxamide formyltransferase/IMP cyclohydrolase [Spirochaetota bacterium]